MRPARRQPLASMKAGCHMPVVINTNKDTDHHHSLF